MIASTMIFPICTNLSFWGEERSLRALSNKAIAREVVWERVDGNGETILGVSAVSVGADVGAGVVRFLILTSVLVRLLRVERWGVIVREDWSLERAKEETVGRWMG